MAISSIKVWNDEYTASKESNENTFRGLLSSTGNGYNYLNDSADFGQYDSKQEAWSLLDTRLYNEQFVFDGAYESVAPQNMKSSISYPNKNYWFRTLLYNIKWQYPKYYNDDSDQTYKIKAFDIVSGGSYFYGVVNRQSGSEMPLMIPYNIMYSLYPRCAYNDEDDVAIVFMLRCPSVVKENQYEMNYSDLLIPNIDKTFYDDKENYQIGNDQNISL